MIILVCLSALGCDEEVNALEGTYAGVYYRTDPNGNRGLISNVTFTFDENSFTGASDISRYPAICEGTFFASGKSVTFVNGCIWTADFDWSLITSGEYKVFRNADKIFLIKKLEGFSYYTYELKRK